MKNLTQSSIFLFTCIFLSCSDAPNANLQDEEAPPPPTASMKGFYKDNLSKDNRAFIEEAVEMNLTCAQPPKIEDVKTGELTYTDYFYSVKQAYSLGIPVVSLNLSSNSKVFVRDYSRYKTCPSADGKTEIKYGHVIRTVIEIQNLDASEGTDLATIAAKGTLEKRRQTFYLYKNGIDNPEIDEIIASVSGKVFDVENYSLYQNIMTKMISILRKPATKWSVNPIGVVKKVEGELFLEEAPIITYVISRIEKGKNCEEIKASFKDNNNALELVDRIFSAMNIECNATSPNEESKLKAKRFLQGVRVR